VESWIVDDGKEPKVRFRGHLWFLGGLVVESQIEFYLGLPGAIIFEHTSQYSLSFFPTPLRLVGRSADTRVTHLSTE